MKAILALLFAAGAAWATPLPVVVQSPVGTFDPQGSVLPFVLANVRYQQVYSAFDFRSLPAGGGWITAIGVVPGPDSGPFGIFLNDTEIRFSTTARNLDGLSAMFADNTGTDEIIAFHGSSSFVDTAATPGFELFLTQPFFYDPAAGNLLMDVRMFLGATTPPLQPIPTLATVTRLGDGASFAWARDLNNPTADFVGTSALFTYFAITPVPEPGVTALLLTAIALAAFVHWRRRAAARWPRSNGLALNP